MNPYIVISITSTYPPFPQFLNDFLPAFLFTLNLYQTWDLTAVWANNTVPTANNKNLKVIVLISEGWLSSTQFGHYTSNRSILFNIPLHKLQWQSPNKERSVLQLCDIFKTPTVLTAGNCTVLGLRLLYLEQLAEDVIPIGFCCSCDVQLRLERHRITTFRVFYVISITTRAL